MYNTSSFPLSDEQPDVRSKGENNEVINEDSINKIHTMRVTAEYDVYLNKETDTKHDNRNLPMSEDTRMFTGTFKDKVRRIDIILVIQDSRNPEFEDLKAKFLRNIVKSGLQIETDPGVMNSHKNLTFVKVHAPDSVLVEYGNKFGVKSYFKNSRLDFITPKRTLIENIFAFTKIHHEREWIKIVRENYRAPHFYSTAERTLIVYKILLFLPDHVNYLGLNKLLKKKVILDAYALHDGPYFFLQKQEMSRVNARQVLCYNWVGLKNIFKVQPLDLIHEYFGPRIAFYFGFYGLYNQALAVAAFVSIISTTVALLDRTSEVVKSDTCRPKKNIWICPECEKFKMCPFRKIQEYCDTMDWNIFLDNEFTVYFSMFIVLWATLFVIFWKRREYYWRWMWELNRHDVIYQSAVRPDYEMNYNNAKISKRTGIIKNYESGVRKLWRFVLSKSILLIWFLGIVLFIALSLYWKDKAQLDYYDSLRTKEAQYMFLAMFEVTFVVLSSLIEKLCKRISYYLVNFENHRTHVSYERSLVIKIFGYTFLFTFPIIIFIAWLQGLHFILPIRANLFYMPRSYYYTEFLDWLQSLPFLRRNCGPFPCIIELSILFLTVLILKQIIFRIFIYFTSFKTDYNQKGNDENIIIPYWEFEYKLKSVTEELIMDKYNTLAHQFALVTLLVPAFPLASLLALLINIWDIRYHARLFLLNSRRPLLLKRSGLGAWTGVFIFISLLAIFSNAFTIVRDTRTVLRSYYIARFGNMTKYLGFTLSSAPTRMYRETVEYGNEMKLYKGVMPAWCYFTGFIGNIMEIRDQEKTLYLIHLFYNSNNKLTVKYEHSQLKYYETLFIFLYELVLICTVLILHYLIPSHPSELKETQQMEDRIKDNYLHRAKETE